jgi:hypothetical protein
MPEQLEAEYDILYNWKKKLWERSTVNKFVEQIGKDVRVYAGINNLYTLTSEFVDPFFSLPRYYRSGYAPPPVNPSPPPFVETTHPNLNSARQKINVYKNGFLTDSTFRFTNWQGDFGNYQLVIDEGDGDTSVSLGKEVRYNWKTSTWSSVNVFVSRNGTTVRVHQTSSSSSGVDVSFTNPF